EPRAARSSTPTRKACHGDLERNGAWPRARGGRHGCRPARLPDDRDVAITALARRRAGGGRQACPRRRLSALRGRGAPRPRLESSPCPPRRPSMVYVIQGSLDIVWTSG